MPRPTRLNFLLASALLASVFLIYSPALSGDFLWDDAAHVSANSQLTSLEGLKNIWLKPGSVQQYYPMTYTVFWIQRHLWGLDPRGYHLFNIGLHALNALLFAWFLRKLKIPGAWIAGWLFAMHPVCVESVAWISELKNTLSMCFALLSALAFLQSAWTLSIPLFALALLSKSITAMLPFAYLAILFWMKDKRLRDLWRRILPHVALALAIGAFTWHMEQTVIGAATQIPDFTVVQKIFLAAKNTAFYFSKLVYPYPLVFIYPKWQPPTAGILGHLDAITVLLLSIGCFAMRKYGKWPMACLLFYGICLIPALGFTKIYPMRFSFVADHFQYLASLGFFTAAGMAITKGLTRLSLRLESLAVRGFLGLLILDLALLSARQASLYSSAEQLWNHTLEWNPTCALAHHEVGILEAQKAHDRTAVAHLKLAEALDPTFPQTHLALAYLAHRAGQKAEAKREYEQAFALGIQDPNILADYKKLFSN